jgi:hypothetical protein
MDFGTASLLEIVWTSLAALSLGGWLGAIWTARRDWRAVRTRPTYHRDGPRATIIRARLWGAILDALVQAAFVALGVGAMLTPPPLRTLNQDQAIRGGLLLIAIEGLLLLRTVLVRTSRARIDRALDRRARKEI